MVVVGFFFFQILNTFGNSQVKPNFSNYFSDCKINDRCIEINKSKEKYRKSPLCLPTEENSNQGCC